MSVTERPPTPKRTRSGWEIAGIVAAVVLAVGTLVVIAFAVLVVLAFSSYGSNK
jgi:hypothetical protein